MPDQAPPQKRLSYYVFERRGNSAHREQLCGLVNRAIVASGRRREFPQVRYEYASKARWGDEFFTGVAVDWAACVGLPDPEGFLFDLLAKTPGAGKNGLYDAKLIPDGPDLRALLTTLHGCEGYTGSLAFQPDATACRLAELSARVAAADEAEAVADAAARTGTGQGYEQLLYWCAAVGGGPLATLASAAAAVGVLPADGSRLWPLLRRLELLGHVKAFQDQGRWRWCIAPTVYLQPLALDGPPFAAGQRLPSAWDEDGATDTPQPDRDGPARLASPAWFADESARLFAELLPPFDDYRDGLPAVPGDPGKVFCGYAIKRLTDEGHPGPPVAVPGTAGVHQFTRHADGRSTSLYALPDPDPSSGIWVRADPLTLTFAHRVTHAWAVAVIDPDRRTVTVPLVDRWPLPYEKALVLASGLLPRLVRGGGNSGPALQYAGVPGDYAADLCDKLGVRHTAGCNHPADGINTGMFHA